MKKFILSIFFLVLFLFTGCKKNSNPANANSNPSSSANIDTSAFITTPTGGDPRGTYSPNTPLIKLYWNNNLPITVSTEYQTDSGGGTVTFSGSSSTSGTYSSNNLKMNISGSITISAIGRSQTISLDSLDNVFNRFAESGTWSVISKEKIDFDNEDTVNYAVNDKGMFIIIPLTDTANGVTYGNMVFALKK